MLMKHSSHRVRGVSIEQCSVLWWTITHTVIIPLLGPCQPPHAHSARLTLPFTHSVSIHKQASLHLGLSHNNIKIWEGENSPGRCWRSMGNGGPTYYRIYAAVCLNSHLVGSSPIGWASYTPSAHQEVFNWKRVWVWATWTGQKIQIASVICPPSVPQWLASTRCALTKSQSLQTLGKHSCAFGKSALIMMQTCFFYSLIHL